MASDGLDAMVVQMEHGDLAQELHATQALRKAGLSANCIPTRSS